MAAPQFRFPIGCDVAREAARTVGVKPRRPPLIPSGRFALAHRTGGEQKFKQFLFKIQNACYRELCRSRGDLILWVGPERMICRCLAVTFPNLRSLTRW